MTFLADFLHGAQAPSNQDGEAMTRVKTFRKRVWLFLKRAFYYDTRITEFCSICYLLWMALILGSNDQTFQTSISFKYLADFLPQSGWSLICFTLAILHCGSTFFDLYQMRRRCVLFISFFWIVWAVELWRGNPFSMGAGFYLIFAISYFWVFLRGPHNNKTYFVEADGEGNLQKRVL